MANISDNLGHKYIQTALDTGQPTTRSFLVGDVGLDLDFELTYNTVTSKGWSYDDVTKIFTYEGTKSAIYSFAYNLSVQRTDTGGSPIMSISVKKEPQAGGGYTVIPHTWSYRTFSGVDVGYMGTDVLLEVNPGDKFKMNISVDAVLDIDVKNLAIHFHVTDTNP